MMAAAIQGGKSEMTAFANSSALGEVKPSLPSRQQLYPGLMMEPATEAETAEPAAQAVNVHRTVKRSSNPRSKLPRNLQGCMRIA